MLTFERHLDFVESGAAGLADAAGRAGLTAPVPTCPEWDVERLVRHATRPLQWATANAEAGGKMVSLEGLERPPTGEAATDFFRAAAGTCVATLRAVGPEAPAWGWGHGDGHADWLARRMAHEMAVHRYDAEAAAGAPQPIDGELALDGIDEFLGLAAWAGFAAGTGETVHLHCTDRDGEWLLHRDADGLRVEPIHAKGDVAARGTASDLLLVLQSRLPVTAVETFGDAGVLEAWQREVSF